MTNMLNNARDVDVSNTTFNINTVDHHSSNNPEFNLLLRDCTLAALADAEESSNAPKCDPDTRREVMAEITNWIMDDKATEILWLHGLAGAGKTALGQTLADLRWIDTDSDVGVPAHTGLPWSNKDIVKRIKEVPGIFHKNMKTQMNQLVLTPLYRVQSSAPYRFKRFLGRVQPRVIVVDGLDECSDSNSQCELLEVFANAAQDFRLPLRILIASRPDINSMITYVGRIPIKQIGLLTDVEQLVKKASGQFAYTATFVDYIKSDRRVYKSSSVYHFARPMNPVLAIGSPLPSYTVLHSEAHGSNSSA
ncbi:hypothetical protein NLJ89_g6520 [Agrocybe chaxingu]|uniref:Nephrocystin 3-like N-terminal domain-containing protein n=1 Tax=Agrocybe chaxingu TaxID=84603 RepID=A0A9W8JWB7_9AGAR|nr:hypothetical protein NLJ89_g6520 [Agrocybe chaxingu]